VHALSGNPTLTPNGVVDFAARRSASPLRAVSPAALSAWLVGILETVSGDRSNWIKLTLPVPVPRKPGRSRRYACFCGNEDCDPTSFIPLSFRLRHGTNRPLMATIGLEFVQIMVHIIARRTAMDVMNYSDTRARLKKVMDRVVADHTPVVISRQSGESVVMVSLADWNAMEETLHLLGSPTNARRLKTAVAQLDAGNGRARELVPE
jgi:antitoxin YefM